MSGSAGWLCTVSRTLSASESRDSRSAARAASGAAMSQMVHEAWVAFAQKPLSAETSGARSAASARRPRRAAQPPALGGAMTPYGRIGPGSASGRVPEVLLAGGLDTPTG